MFAFVAQRKKLSQVVFSSSPNEEMGCPLAWSRDPPPCDDNEKEKKLIVRKSSTWIQLGDLLKERVMCA